MLRRRGGRAREAADRAGGGEVREGHLDPETFLRVLPGDGIGSSRLGRVDGAFQGGAGERVVRATPSRLPLQEGGSECAQGRRRRAGGRAAGAPRLWGAPVNPRPAGHPAATGLALCVRSRCDVVASDKPPARCENP